MNVFIFYTIILCSCIGAFSDSFGFKSNKDTLIAKLLTEADLVVRAKMKSYWMPEKEGIDNAELIIKETIITKNRDQFILKENDILKISRGPGENIIDFLYYPGAEYIIFLSVNDYIEVDSKRMFLTPLNFGGYLLSPFEEIEIMEKAYSGEEKILQAINRIKESKRSIHGFYDPEMFVEILRELVAFLEKGIIPESDNKYFRSNYRYLLDHMEQKRK